MSSKLSVSKPKERDYKQTKRRNCLSCQKEIVSTWFGQRVCGRCKETDSWQGSHCEEYGLGQ